MRPNLFIIGAPKCGTSSLFDWLTSHPDIRGSRVKEPFILTNPASPLSRRPNLVHDGMEAYETLFAPEDANAPVRLEATTHYLFDRMARDAIAAMSDSQVIVALREPATRVYSSFQYTANNLARLSPSLTFEHYVSMIKAGERLTSKWCSHEGSAYVLERDINYSRYALHLRPWIKAMGRNRIKIFIMEDMIRDPNATLRQVLDWLGLDLASAAPLELAGRNRTEQVRVPALQAFARRINARVRSPAPIRRLAESAYGALQFRKSATITPEDAEMLRRLKADYAADNAELSRITGLDLGVWST